MVADKNTIRKRLFQAIDDSLALLNQVSIKEQKPAKLEVSMPSLLDQCIKLCEQHYSKIQEPIRIVQHFGLPPNSLLLPSLATIPNTQVLKDICQNHNRIKDEIRSEILVAKKIPASNDVELNENDYKTQNQALLNYLQQMLQESSLIGQRLVIYDNYFSSWTKGRQLADLLSLDSSQFMVKSLAIVIDPVDGYAIYRRYDKENCLLSFEQYCQRFFDFIQINSDLKIIKYEDFLSKPEKVMGKICEHLGLAICHDFDILRSVFDIENEDKEIDCVMNMDSPDVYHDLCRLIGYD